MVLIGSLERIRPRLPLPLRIVAGAVIITLVELGIGLTANRDYRIWDYRDQPGNFLGQICPGFCLLWIPLSALALGISRRLEKAIR